MDSLNRKSFPSLAGAWTKTQHQFRDLLTRADSGTGRDTDAIDNLYSGAHHAHPFDDRDGLIWLGMASVALARGAPARAHACAAHGGAVFEGITCLWRL